TARRASSATGSAKTRCAWPLTPATGCHCLPTGTMTTGGNNRIPIRSAAPRQGLSGLQRPLPLLRVTPEPAGHQQHPLPPVRPLGPEGVSGGVPLCEQRLDAPAALRVRRRRHGGHRPPPADEIPVAAAVVPLHGVDERAARARLAEGFELLVQPAQGL